MRRSVIGLLLAGFAATSSGAEQTREKVQLATLLSGQLARVDNTEVVVSKVHIPPNMSLPKHWHPGEEFVYVIAGRVTVWQEGKDEMVFEGGDAGKVPLKQIHTAITGAEGAELVVFRVHEKGQPERVLIEDPK